MCEVTDTCAEINLVLKNNAQGLCDDPDLCDSE